mgnify:CR=1 FL=1
MADPAPILAVIIDCDLFGLYFPHQNFIKPSEVCNGLCRTNQQTGITAAR